MTGSDKGLLDLRVPVPTLEPDDAFLTQLSMLAAGSAPSGGSAGLPPGSGWRPALAAAGVAVVVGGGSWLVTNLAGDSESPSSPTSPLTRPASPPPETAVDRSQRPRDQEPDEGPEASPGAVRTGPPAPTGAEPAAPSPADDDQAGSGGAPQTSGEDDGETSGPGSTPHGPHDEPDDQPEGDGDEPEDDDQPDHSETEDEDDEPEDEDEEPEDDDRAGPGVNAGSWSHSTDRGN